MSAFSIVTRVHVGDGPNPQLGWNNAFSFYSLADVLIARYRANPAAAELVVNGVTAPGVTLEPRLDLGNGRIACSMGVTSGGACQFAAQGVVIAGQQVGLLRNGEAMSFAYRQNDVHYYVKHGHVDLVTSADCNGQNILGYANVGAAARATWNATH